MIFNKSFLSNLSREYFICNTGDLQLEYKSVLMLILLINMFHGTENMLLSNLKLTMSNIPLSSAINVEGLVTILENTQKFFLAK